jgi:formamidopyrimidine-DNA glycosylase
MPELPDVTVYVESLDARFTGATLDDVILYSPFLLRSVEPPLAACRGKRILGFSRLGKRIVIALDDDIFLVVHLMIAGRFQLPDEEGTKKVAKKTAKKGAKANDDGAESPALDAAASTLAKKPPSKIALAQFTTSKGRILLTEAGTKKRASLYVVRGRDALQEHNRGGIEPLSCTLEQFATALRRENHTLKRSLTDPRVFSGIGNAYSDEILFAAKLSPFVLTSKIDDDNIARLYDATVSVLTRFTDAMRAELNGQFPTKVTAFRPDMRVHGRYGEPCVVCGAKVQRIVHGENESNYCANCQTGGRLLADRALSRLLKDDWPRSLDELEAKKAEHRAVLGTSKT